MRGLYAVRKFLSAEILQHAYYVQQLQGICQNGLRRSG
jgi:hypothetical protein